MNIDGREPVCWLPWSVLKALKKGRNETMNATKDTLREVFLRFWYEYAVFNTEDVDDGQVVAQGECSGKYYVLTLDDDLSVIDADIYC